MFKHRDGLKMYWIHHRDLEMNGSDGKWYYWASSELDAINRYFISVNRPCFTLERYIEDGWTVGEVEEDDD